MKNRPDHILIVGAGLVGSLLALYLVRRGYRVSLYEQRPDPRTHNTDQGRSINLALSNRGLLALEELGLREEVKKLAIPMAGRMMHDHKGNLTFQPYGKRGQSINSISRGGLNQLLIDRAESEGASFHFHQQCREVDLEKSSLIFESEGEMRTVSADLVIGSDGAFSAIRGAMQRTNRFQYEQYFIDHGYMELTMPAKNGQFALDPNALHIWPRNRFMLIALPNLDHSFTCTLFLPFEGENSFEHLETPGMVRQFFRREFPDALELIPDLEDQHKTNPVGSLVTIRSYPWSRYNALILGDAAHAIVPFYGQGMNCGFEDCRILNQLIGDKDHHWPEILEAFQSGRKPDADAISRLALDNFIEMRDRVADEEFLLRKKIEAHLHEQYPEQWIPQYSMVTFYPEIRYSEALKKGNIQHQLMDELMAEPGIRENWKERDYEEIIHRLAAAS